MAAELDGPRLGPRAGGRPRQLVVFLHGYGADGNDLIEIGRAWQALLPQAAFVAPHAPEPCGSGAFRHSERHAWLMKAADVTKMC